MADLGNSDSHLCFFAEDVVLLAFSVHDFQFVKQLRVCFSKGTFRPCAARQ